jgi:hypothetical protein
MSLPDGLLVRKCFRVKLSEASCRLIQIGGSSFGGVEQVRRHFSSRRRVRRLAASFRHIDPRSTSQIDVSLPMKSAHRARAIAHLSPVYTDTSPEAMGCVSRDEHAARAGLLGSKAASPEDRGVSLAKNACPDPWIHGTYVFSREGRGGVSLAMTPPFIERHAAERRVSHGA